MRNEDPRAEGARRPLNMDRTLLEKTYKLMRWLLERTAKFPRDFRCSLAVHVNSLLFELFDGELMALTAKSRARPLLSLSTTLDTLRYCIRLCMDMKLLSIKQYEYCAQSLGEIGRLLGGWIKAESALMADRWGRGDSRPACCGAGPGTTMRTTAGPPTATTTNPTTGTTMSGFGWCAASSIPPPRISRIHGCGSATRNPCSLGPAPGA